MDILINEINSLSIIDCKEKAEITKLLSEGKLDECLELKLFPLFGIPADTLFF